MRQFKPNNALGHRLNKILGVPLKFPALPETDPHEDIEPLYMMENDFYRLYIDRIGGLVEWDLKEECYNITNLGFFEHFTEGKELDKRALKKKMRRALIEVLNGEVSQLKAVGVAENGTPETRTVVADKRDDELQMSFKYLACGGLFEVEKKYVLEGDALLVEYTVENKGDATVELEFAVELTVTLPTDTPACSVLPNVHKHIFDYAGSVVETSVEPEAVDGPGVCWSCVYDRKLNLVAGMCWAPNLSLIHI